MALQETLIITYWLHASKIVSITHQLMAKPAHLPQFFTPLMFSHVWYMLSSLRCTLVSCMPLRTLYSFL